MTTGIIFTILVIIHTAKSHQWENKSLTASSSGDWQPVSDKQQPKYVKLTLLQPGEEEPHWRPVPQNPRHIEWLQSSHEDNDSSERSGFVEGIIDDVFGSEKKLIRRNDDVRENERRRKHAGVHKALLPLLLAYKLKYFTLIPMLVGALVLLVYTTGLAGFFFALFAAAAGLHINVKPNHH